MGWQGLEPSGNGVPTAMPCCCLQARTKRALHTPRTGVPPCPQEGAEHEEAAYEEEGGEEGGAQLEEAEEALPGEAEMEAEAEAEEAAGEEEEGAPHEGEAEDEAGLQATEEADDHEDAGGCWALCRGCNAGLAPRRRRALRCRVPLHSTALAAASARD